MSGNEFNKNIFNDIEKVKEIYLTVKNNVDKYIIHDIINPKFVTDNQTVSIVMTTHDRIAQTLFTLDTINSSTYKNIQVIIVDDGGKFINLEQLSKYPYRIDYIKIKNETREWVNPCVNYNIGFRYVLGNTVIIQNAEVCHYGDVISYVKGKIKENNYMIFDVINTAAYEINDMIHAESTNGIVKKETFQKIVNNPICKWYQHSQTNNKKYHFLSAMTKSDFNKLSDGFDYDFSVGRCYDDLEIIFRIEKILKMNCVTISNSEENVAGIHQHHYTVYLGANTAEYGKSYLKNRYIYTTKINYFVKHGRWPITYDQI